MSIKIDYCITEKGKKFIFTSSGEKIYITDDDFRNGKLEEVNIKGEKYYLHQEKKEFYYIDKNGIRVNYSKKNTKANNNFNSKLKKLSKKEMQKLLLLGKNAFNQELKERFERQNEIDLLMSSEESKLLKEMSKYAKKATDIILKLLGVDFYVKVGVGVAVFLIIVISSICMSQTDSTGEEAFEGKETEIIEMMAQLDSQCGSKLAEGFTITGDTEGDWKTVLSLYMGCYDSEISEVSGTYVSAIEQASATYGVDKWLICGVITTESSWIFHEPNQYTACGFMQVTEVCAQDMGYDYEQVKTDPYTNIMCGVGYLRKMIDSCHGDTILGLAAYNSGLGNVMNYGWNVPPYKETQDYVKKVPQYARYYESGTWHIPDGTVAMDTDLSRFYWAVNKVESSSALKRNTLEEAMQELNFNEDQIEAAEELFEADSWELFDTDEEYAYNIKAAAVSGFPGIQFITGDRPSGQAIIDHAMTQLGNVGGEPYWRYYGFNSRVEWCATYVHWCMNTEPTGAGKNYPTIAQTGNNAYCPALVKWFKRIRCWADRGFTNLVPGDVIFFDWESNGEVDHVGLVVGRDENYVYTIEGNSSDMVRTKQYGINSPSIQGYGLMQY